MNDDDYPTDTDSDTAESEVDTDEDAEMDEEDADDETPSSEPPFEFRCQLTGCAMRDPVRASDGFVYDRNAIMERLIYDARTSPITDEVLTTDLVPCVDLKARIAAWREKEALFDFSVDETDADDETDRVTESDSSGSEWNESEPEESSGDEWEDDDDDDAAEEPPEDAGVGAPDTSDWDKGVSGFVLDTWDGCCNSDDAADDGETTGRKRRRQAHACDCASNTKRHPSRYSCPRSDLYDRNIAKMEDDMAKSGRRGIPDVAMSRMIDEILADASSGRMSMTRNARKALHTEVERLLVDGFVRAQDAVVRRATKTRLRPSDKALTVHPSDLRDAVRAATYEP